MSRHHEESRPEAVTRIDSAHAVDAEIMPHAGRPFGAVPATVPVAECVVPEGEPLRLQAEQLADHLRSRLRDLDQRESLVNSRVAEFENEQRVTRLWFQEREHEFAAREEALRQQLADLQQRARAFAAEEAAAGEERAQQEHELRRRDEAVATRERKLAEQLRRLAEEAETVRLERDRLDAQKAEAEQTRQRQLLDLEERDKRGAEAEARLVEQRRQLDEEAAQVRAQRELLSQTAAGEQRFWAERNRQLSTEWTEAQQVLAAERTQLNRREEELRQLYAEAVRLQQSAAESRLAAERLWLRLNGNVAATGIDDTWRHTRAPRAEQLGEWDQERCESPALAAALLQRLEAKATALAQQQQAVEAWLADSRRQLNEREARLVASLSGAALAPLGEVASTAELDCGPKLKRTNAAESAMHRKAG